MKIIVEGPDCAGKTTFIDDMLRSTMPSYYGVKHNGPLLELDAKQFKQKMVNQLKYDQTLVIDRHWPSEVIYGETYRQSCRLSIEDQMELTRLFIANQGIMIFCQPSFKKSKELFMARQSEEYLPDAKSFEKVFNAYLAFVARYITDFQGSCLVYKWDSETVTCYNARNHSHVNAFCKRIMRIIDYRKLDDQGIKHV